MKLKKQLNEIWLDNIKEMLTMSWSLLTVRSSSIIYIEWNEMTLYMSTFICIREAAEQYEFIVTDNAFHIFEEDCSEKHPHQAYHYFYPTSLHQIIILTTK